MELPNIARTGMGQVANSAEQLGSGAASSLEQLPKVLRDILTKARTSWLRNQEVVDLLTNYRTYRFRVSKEPPQKPPGVRTLHQFTSLTSDSIVPRFRGHRCQKTFHLSWMLHCMKREAALNTKEPSCMSYLLPIPKCECRRWFFIPLQSEDCTFLQEGRP